MLCKAIVCDDEAATRFQGMKDLVQHSLVVRKVMVRVHDQNRVEPVDWKSRIIRSSLDNFNVGRVERLYSIVQHSHPVIRDVLRKNFPFRTDNLRKPHGVVAAACADVSNPITTRRLQSGDETGSILIRLPAYVTGFEILHCGWVFDVDRSRILEG